MKYLSKDIDTNNNIFKNGINRNLLSLIISLFSGKLKTIENIA